MSTELFYAWVKNANDNVTYRYMITFSTRDVADGWWRAITDSVAGGYQRFSNIQRVNLQFYTHNPLVANIPETIVDPKCAKSFSGQVFFTSVPDRDQRIVGNTFEESLSYTDRVSGSSFFIRSVVEPRAFWYCDEDGAVRASPDRRTRFKISIADKQKPAGTIMIGSDDVTIGILDSANYVGILPAPKGSKSDDALVVTSTPFSFKFADFSGGFDVEYDKDYISTLRWRKGEKWELS
ncbi:hypothetical protein BD779DRAFT_1093174 [Infundibulicybe gibba]|nr:hypothetical protein BD779DRAFT_1093174 [Infundibulicybe gibba]